MAVPDGPSIPTKGSFGVARGLKYLFGEIFSLYGKTKRFIQDGRYFLQRFGSRTSQLTLVDDESALVRDP